MAKSTTKTTSTGDSVEPTGNLPDDAPKAPRSDASLRIKYTGSTMHTRVLNDRDFKQAGLDGVGKQEWNLENNHTVDFSEAENGEAIAKFLTESDLFKSEGKQTFKRLDAGEM